MGSEIINLWWGELARTVFHEMLLIRVTAGLYQMCVFCSCCHVKFVLVYARCACISFSFECHQLARPSRITSLQGFLTGSVYCGLSYLQLVRYSVIRNFIFSNAGGQTLPLFYYGLYA